MLNRLDELKRSRSNKTESAIDLVQIEVDDGVDEVIQAIQGIMAGICRLETNIATINALRQRSRQEFEDDVQRQIMEDLDRTMIALKRDARFVKSELDRLQLENQKYIIANEGSTSAQIRKNLLNTHSKHFQQVVEDYQEAGNAFRESIKERIARQARIVKEDIIDEEIDELIASKNPGAIFQSTVLQIDDRMIEAIQEIEDRHKGMMAIEQAVREIQELFQDMACLVDLQQETFDVIETNVRDTIRYTKDAEQNMIKAELHAKSSRRKQCWILLLVAIVAMVIVCSFIPKMSSRI